MKYYESFTYIVSWIKEPFNVNHVNINVFELFCVWRWRMWVCYSLFIIFDNSNWIDINQLFLFIHNDSTNTSPYSLKMPFDVEKNRFYFTWYKSQTAVEHTGCVSGMFGFVWMRYLYTGLASYSKMYVNDSETHTAFASTYLSLGVIFPFYILKQKIEFVDSNAWIEIQFIKYMNRSAVNLACLRRLMKWSNNSIFNKYVYLLRALDFVKSSLIFWIVVAMK